MLAISDAAGWRTLLAPMAPVAESPDPVDPPGRGFSHLPELVGRTRTFQRPARVYTVKGQPVAHT